MSERDFDKGFKSGYNFGKEVILDKIRQSIEDIQKLRGCSCSCSDGIIDDIEDILEKLIESEENNG